MQSKHCRTANARQLLRSPAGGKDTCYVAKHNKEWFEIRCLEFIFVSFCEYTARPLQYLSRRSPALNRTSINALRVIMVMMINLLTSLHLHPEQMSDAAASRPTGTEQG